MVAVQNPYIDNNGNERNDLIKHYSDKGVYIRQIETGIEYIVAIDVMPCRYTYEETDRLIESEGETNG